MKFRPIIVFATASLLLSGLFYANLAQAGDWVSNKVSSSDLSLRMEPSTSIVVSAALPKHKPTGKTRAEIKKFRNHLCDQDEKRCKSNDACVSCIKKLCKELNGCIDNCPEQMLAPCQTACVNSYNKHYKACYSK